jgi:hypothetical protein
LRLPIDDQRDLPLPAQEKDQSSRQEHAQNRERYDFLTVHPNGIVTEMAISWKT